VTHALIQALIQGLNRRRLVTCRLEWVVELEIACYDFLLYNNKQKFIDEAADE